MSRGSSQYCTMTLARKTGLGELRSPHLRKSAGGWLGGPEDRAWRTSFSTLEEIGRWLVGALGGGVYFLFPICSTPCAC